MFHISGEKGLSSLESYPLPWRYHRSGFSQQCPFPASAVGRLPDAAQSGPSCPGPFPPGHPAAVRQLSGRRFQTSSPQTAGSCSLGLQSPVAWPCRQDGQTGLAALILLHPALSWRMISTTLPSSPSPASISRHRHRFVTKPAYTEYASFSDYSAGDGTWKASFYSYWYFWPSWPQWTFSWVKREKFERYLDQATAV